MGFNYQSLEHDEIRLLRLRPAASLDAPLRITLFHARLPGADDKDKAPDYEALSYAWGEVWGHFPVWVESEEEAVGVEEKEDGGDNNARTGAPFIAVTANLDAALRHIRYRCSEEEEAMVSDNGKNTHRDRVLWVDAICINQADKAERSRQVQQMRRIYESCVCDIAWLGPTPAPPHTKPDLSVSDTETEDGSDGPAEKPRKNKETPEEREERKAARRAEKVAERFREDVERHAAYEQRQAKRLREGLALMRKVASRDAETLSAMVQQWHEEKKGSRFGRLSPKSADGDDEKKKKTPHKYDPTNPDQKHFLTYEQVRALYTTLSDSELWKRVWVVQELSCAPKVLLAVGIADDDSTGAELCRDRVNTLNWDEDLVGGFLDDKVYTDAFHSAWGHGTMGPAAARIFAHVRVLQLQRRMMRDRWTGGVPELSQGRQSTGTREDGKGDQKEDGKDKKEDEKGDEKRDEDDRSLMNVLARFKSSLSTDPRDKVYGFLGLLAEEALYLPPVDYNKTPAEVFCDAALAIIQTSGCLDLISQNPFHGIDESEDHDNGKEQVADIDGDLAMPSDSSPRVPNLPSWVPNFDRNLHTDYYDEFSTLLFAQRGIYAAGKPDCRHLLPLRVERGWVAVRGERGGRRPVCGIRLRGTVLGRISLFRQGAWEEGSKDKYSPRMPVTNMVKMRALYVGGEDGAGEDGETLTKNTPKNKIYRATGEPLWDAFWRTMTTDCQAYPIKRLSMAERAQCSRMLAEACRLREAEIAVEDAETAHFTTDDEWREYRYGKNSTWKPVPPSAALLEDTLVSDMLRRMMSRWDMAEATTILRQDEASSDEFGNLFLMVRSAARVGDVVAVLDGSKVPVVLRAQDITVEVDRAGKDRNMVDEAASLPPHLQPPPYYNYICPAYVHGYMDGEAITQVTEGKLVEQDFVLI